MARKRRGRRKKRQPFFKRLNIFQKILLFLGILLIAIVIAGVVYAASKYGKIQTKTIDTSKVVVNEDVKEQKKADLGSGYTNIALFGVDSRENQLDKGTLSDSIIIASLNNETKEIRMISVYRDTLMNLSEGTYQKCNSAYSYGGAELAMSMLNMNLDLDIQDFVTVNIAVVADLVDTVGGVEIKVTEEELPAINKYIGETARIAGKKGKKLKKAGTQTLNGVQATTYARVRKVSGGDYVRAERQRIVIEKIIEKLKSSDIATLNKIIDEVFPNILTSFKLTDILNYASLYQDYKIGESKGFPFTKTTATLPSSGSTVVPATLYSNVVTLHQFLFDKEDYVPSSAVNEINSYITMNTGVGEMAADGQGDTTGTNGTGDTGATSVDDSATNSANSNDGSGTYANNPKVEINEN